MKKILISLALLTGLTAPLSVMAIDISINLGEPNFYGPLQLSNMPPPQLLYSNPVIIQSGRGFNQTPLYLRVPPGQIKKWGANCGRWNACNRPVYFVRDDWYQNTYAPRYLHDHPGHGHDRSFDRDNHRRDQWDRNDHKNHKKHKDRKDHWDRDDHDGQGHGRGHGKGHDDRH